MADGPDREDRSSADNRKGSRNADEPRRRTPWEFNKTVTWPVLVAVIGGLILLLFGHLGNFVSDIFNRPEGMPVQIELVSQSPEYGFTQALSVPLSSPQLASLNSLNVNAPGYQDWFTSHGAAEVGGAQIELVVQGNRNNLVRIINIQLVDETCGKPLTGALFFSPPAGSEPSTLLTLNLDNQLERAGYYQDGRFHADYFRDSTVPLVRGEQHTFNINASTSTQSCKFALNMTVQDGAQKLSETITDNGQPFRATAPLYRWHKTGRFTGFYSGFGAYKSLYLGGVAPRDVKLANSGAWDRVVNPSSYRA
jgi:hypothetical protein